MNSTIKKGTSMLENPLVTVLLTDKTRRTVLTPAAEARLAQSAELRFPEGEPETWDLVALLDGADACLTGWGTPTLGQEVLDASTQLRFIAHTAGSIRGLLPADAVGGRLRVSQAADIIAASVAEMVILQILMQLRELHRLDSGLRNGGEWFDLRAEFPGRLLGVQTVAVIGASRTGRSVMELLRPFGCEMLLVDPFITDDECTELGARKVDLETALRSCHVLTLHAPVLPETEKMIGQAELASLRDGALLINSARALLVDGEALRAELLSGRIRAALDVFPREPLALDDEWREIPHAVISPHSAGHTVDAHYSQGDVMVDEIERLVGGHELRYEIFPDTASILA